MRSGNNEQTLALVRCLSGIWFLRDISCIESELPSYVMWWASDWSALRVRRYDLWTFTNTFHLMRTKVTVNPSANAN
jgi:hypothetical protein